MELRILARRIPFAPWRKLFPDRLPDSFVIAIRNYRALPLTCDTVVFRAQEQRYPHATNASLGWDRVASPLSVYSIAGDHRAIMVEPQVQAIALGLEQHLATISFEQRSLNHP
jgi:thioesterase domain-containing protein